MNPEEFERRLVKLEESHEDLNESVVKLNTTIALLNQTIEMMAKTKRSGNNFLIVASCLLSVDLLLLVLLGLFVGA